MTAVSEPDAAAGAAVRPGRIGSTPALAGAASIWLSIIVLLPLAAIVWQSADGGWNAFWAAVTSPSAVDSYRCHVEHRRRCHRGQRGIRATRRLGADSR